MGLSGLFLGALLDTFETVQTLGNIWNTWDVPLPAIPVEADDDDDNTQAPLPVLKRDRQHTVT